MPINEENITIGKYFNRYGNNFKVEQDIKDLKAQQRKRSMVIAGYVVLGAVGGYVLGRSLKLTTWAKVYTTLGGSLLLGGATYFITKAKAERRKASIEEKEQMLEQAKYLMEIIKESNTPQATTYVLTNPTKPDDTFKDVMSPIITNK